MGLTDEQIRELMDGQRQARTIRKADGPKFPITTKYARVEQYGPLRWYDTPDGCASRGCGSQTYCKVNGIPRCMIHALNELNDLLVGQL